MLPGNIPSNSGNTEPIKLRRSRSVRDDFLLRLVTTLIFAPIALGAIYLGSPWIDYFVLIVGTIMAWELTKLVTGHTWGGAHTIMVVATPAAIFFLASNQLDRFMWSVIIGAIGSLLLTKSEKREHILWLVVGAAYIPTACGGFILIRSYPLTGQWLTFWIVTVVMATDIGAYTFGKMFGGPKLVPSISPGKTWSGLAGGVITAAIAGYALNAFLGHQFEDIVYTAGLLAVVAQTGDLVESALKRSCGVKDTSNILPGHGGMLDRADGFLAVSLVIMLIIWLQQVSLFN